MLYWIRPSDPEREQWIEEENKFQSLLYWIRPSDNFPVTQDVEVTNLFQSLLYWIRPSDQLRSGRFPTARLDCFNPCCIGLGLQTREHTAYTQSVQLQFQSLLYWIRPSDHGEVWSDCSTCTARFNPCCIGLGLQTLARNFRASGKVAVSILVVLD